MPATRTLPPGCQSDCGKPAEIFQDGLENRAAGVQHQGGAFQTRAERL